MAERGCEGHAEAVERDNPERGNEISGEGLTMKEQTKSDLAMCLLGIILGIGIIVLI